MQEERLKYGTDMVNYGNTSLHWGTLILIHIMRMENLIVL